MQYSSLLTEQVFLHSILTEIDECARMGGFMSAIGGGKTTKVIRQIVPVVAGFVMDNQVLEV